MAEKKAAAKKAPAKKKAKNKDEPEEEVETEETEDEEVEEDGNPAVPSELLELHVALEDENTSPEEFKEVFGS